MSFDAVAFTEALERPEVTLPRPLLGRLLVRVTNLFRSEGRKKPVDRKTYRGRILSAQEFEKHRARFAAVANGDVTPEEGEEFVKDFLLDMRIPWDRVFMLPAPAQKEVVDSFFALQAKANGNEPPQRLAGAWRDSRERPNPATGRPKASPRTATRRTGRS